MIWAPRAPLRFSCVWDPSFYASLNFQGSGGSVAGGLGMGGVDVSGPALWASVGSLFRAPYGGLFAMTGGAGGNVPSTYCRQATLWWICVRGWGPGCWVGGSLFVSVFGVGCVAVVWFCVTFCERGGFVGPVPTLCPFFFSSAITDGEGQAEFEREGLGSETDKEDPVPQEFRRYLSYDKGAYIFGRLRSARQFWATVLRASVVIMSWITVGYQLPFKGGVAPDFGGRWSPNSKGTSGPSSFGDREQFVDEAVAALVQNGAVRECERSFLRLISPLNVVEQNSKLRLIHDLSLLNSFLEFDKFRFEDLRDVQQIFTLGDWAFSIDLQSAYHHVPLHESAWPYMGFAWRGKFYFFRVLPFGLAPAPMVFAKVTSAMVEKWRSEGVRVLPYLDDFLGGATSREGARSAAHTMLGDMQRAG